MTTKLRSGFVQLRSGDWFAVVDGPCEPTLVVARTLPALADKVRHLRGHGYSVDTTAWRQVGHWQQFHTEQYSNLLDY